MEKLGCKSSKKWWNKFIETISSIFETENFFSFYTLWKADNNIMNVNFAPINTNQQNWVNINTEVETDVNVNTGGKKKGKDGKEMEDWEEEFDQGYGKDKYDMEMMKEQMMKMIKVSFTYDSHWHKPLKPPGIT